MRKSYFILPCVFSLGVLCGYLLFSDDELQQMDKASFTESQQDLLSANFVPSHNSLNTERDDIEPIAPVSQTLEGGDPVERQIRTDINAGSLFEAIILSLRNGDTSIIEPFDQLVNRLNDNENEKNEFVESYFNLEPGSDELDMLLSVLQQVNDGQEQMTMLAEKIANSGVRSSYDNVINLMSYGALVTEPVKELIDEIIKTPNTDNQLLELASMVSLGDLDEDTLVLAKQNLERMYRDGEDESKKSLAFERVLLLSNDSDKNRIILDGLSNENKDVQYNAIMAIADTSIKSGELLKGKLVQLASNDDSAVKSAAIEVLRSKFSLLQGDPGFIQAN